MATKTVDEWKEEFDDDGFPTTESKATDPANRENCCLYIKNINPSVDRKKAKRFLYSKAKEFGTIETVLMGDLGTTWALLFLKTHKDAVKVMRGMDKISYINQRLYVLWGQHQETRQAARNQEVKELVWADEPIDFPPLGTEKIEKSVKAEKVDGPAPSSQTTPDAPKRFVELQKEAKALPQEPKLPAPKVVPNGSAKPSPPSPQPLPSTTMAAVEGTPQLHNEKNPPALVPFYAVPTGNPFSPLIQNPFANPLVYHLQVNSVAGSNIPTFLFAIDVTQEQWNTMLFPVLNAMQEQNRKTFVFNGYKGGIAHA